MSEQGGRTATFKGALWMLGSLTSLALMAIGGRELAGHLSTFQIMFWRSTFSFLIIATLLSHFGWTQVRTSAFRVHATRNVFHFAAQFGWFYAIGLIPLVEVFALEFTTPIWLAVMASIILKERLTPVRILAVLVGFVGVMVILRPGVNAISIGSLAALGAAVGYAATHVATRFLALRDAPLCILFYMTAIQMPLGLLPALDHWRWPGPVDWFWLAALGVVSMTAHYTLTRAMQLVEATVAAPMGLLRLPLIAAVGYVFYAEKLEVWVGIGSVLICAGIFLTIRDAGRR
ncbi:MAG: DMT family transporter [Rhodospirillaceae bacterium]